jgi:hypothetical protein
MAVQKVKRVVSLVRVSSKGQTKKDKKSIPLQQLDIVEYAKEYGLIVEREFRLEGVSGAKVLANAEYQEMLSWLRRPDIEGLVISVLDRLSRTKYVSQWGDILRAFEEEIFTGDGAHKLIWCDLSADVGGGLDVHDRNHRDLIVRAFTEADRERERIRKRTLRTRSANRLDPERKTDNLPDGVKHVIDDKEYKTGHFEYTKQSETVFDAFHRVVALETLGSICRTLGFKSETNLRRLLQNEWWLGYKTQLFVKATGKEIDAATGKPYAVGSRVPNPHPVRLETNLVKTPLVDRQTWERVQDILSTKKDEYEIRDKTLKNKFLVAGLLHCSCGLRMHNIGDKPGQRRQACYQCGKYHVRNYEGDCKQPSIPANVMDPYVIRKVGDLLKDGQFVAARIRESTDKAMIETATQDVARETAAIKKLELGLRRLADAIFECEGDTSNLKAKQNEANRELAEARNRQRTAQAKLTETLDDNDIKLIAARIAAVFANFPNLSKTEQKLMLHKYVARISICYGLPDGVFLAPGDPRLAHSAVDAPEYQTDLGKTLVAEWSDNVSARVAVEKSEKQAFILDFVMKPGQPSPYIINDMAGTTSKTLFPGN